ncbi:MAG: type II secretion system F family protein [Armatimonadetes bacterium]|nr:type II secretion system F family protein [Armatimonadota bacterium]
MARRQGNPLRRLEARYQVSDRPSQLWQERDDQILDPFMVRVLRPVMDRFARGGAMLTTKRERSDLQRMLAMAGYPGGVTVKTLQAIRLLLMVAFPLIVCLLLLIIRRIAPAIGSALTPKLFVLVIFCMVVVGYMSLPFIVRYLVKKRQRLIRKTLPDVLDLITIAVEAGMGFDQAMDRVGNRDKGAMGEELLRTGNEIRMGRPWNDAMREMGDRTGEEDVRSLVTALIQSKELGVNLGNVLRAQSQRLREERARRAREQAQKAPTKMMLPLILFIFPTLFIVLMGPAALRAAKELQQTDILKNLGKRQ